MARILVVDDSSSDRRLAATILEKQPDWTMSFATDGGRAIEQLDSDPVDLVLTDMQMPGMNGLDLVIAVRERFPLIPVVLMTGAGSEATAVQALQTGAASYVAKNRLIQDLNETVRSVLAAATASRSDAEILERTIESRSHIVIESDLGLLRSLLHYLRGVIQSTRGIAANDHARVSIALEEALTNAFFHGNLELGSELREQENNQYRTLADQRTRQQPFCDRRIHVITTISPTEAMFVIRDEGNGFDVAGLPDPTDPEYLDRPCGRGVMLMRTFLDKVSFNDVGNEVTLTKYLRTD